MEFDSSSVENSLFTIWYYKLIHFDKIPLSKKKTPDIEDDIQFVLGTHRFKTLNKFIAAFWAIIWFSFSGLVFASLFYDFFVNGQAEIYINDDLVSISWATLPDYLVFVFFMILILLLALFFFITAIKYQIAPSEVMVFTNKNLILISKKQLTKYVWSDFDENRFSLIKTGWARGTAQLPLAESGQTIQLSNIQNPNILFQFIDRKITGNLSLKKYNEFKRKKRISKHNIYVNALSELCLRLGINLQIFLGVALFSAVPFIMIFIKPLVDGGAVIYILDVILILLAIVILMYSIQEILTPFFIKSRSVVSGNLLKTPSFMLGLAQLFYALTIFYFYIKVTFFQYNFITHVEYLFFFFGGILLFFLLFGINFLLLRTHKKRIKPILILREFGDKGFAGNWSELMSSTERIQSTDYGEDSYLFHLKSFIWIKPIFAYFDKRLNKEGFQDDVIDYFEESGFWLDNVTKCAKLASAIIMIPASSESVIDELEMIQENDLTKKTYVLMPPDAQGKYDVEKKWNQIKTDLAKIGYQLPNYVPGGLIYKPGKNYEIVKSWKLYNRMSNLMFKKELYKLTFSDESTLERIYGLN